jgi:CheY-like chemotaxis protein
VSLPIAVVHENESADRRHPASSFSGSVATELPSLRGVRVLVVDDEPDARELLRRVLEHREASVVVAGDGLEAINLLRQQRPDVIVSDIGMPDLDGYEMIRLVRSL